jgi:hypothetical protein
MSLFSPFYIVELALTPLPYLRSLRSLPNWIHDTARFLPLAMTGAQRELGQETSRYTDRQLLQGV